MAELQTIAWVGAGIMGAQLAGHLLDAGYPLTITSRRRSSAEPLIARGARWTETPAEAAATADVTFTMVGYPADVAEVITGDDGVLQAAAPGHLVVDLTTSEPALAAELAGEGAKGGIDVLDAPVSGGDVGARNAALTVMVGGTPEAFVRAEPLLRRFGPTVTHMGPAGSGQHTKMVNQIAISSGMVAMCEALLYADRAGLDPDQILDTIGGGAAGSWSLSNYGPRIRRDDYAAGFKVDHFIKDLGIALDESRRMGIATPGLALAQQLYVATQAQGHGQRGTHALMLALRSLSAETQEHPRD